MDGIFYYSFTSVLNAGSYSGEAALFLSALLLRAVQSVQLCCTGSLRAACSYSYHHSISLHGRTSQADLCVCIEQVSQSTTRDFGDARYTATQHHQQQQKQRWRQKMKYQKMHLVMIIHLVQMHRVKWKEREVRAERSLLGFNLIVRGIIVPLLRSKTAECNATGGGCEQNTSTIYTL